MKKNILFLLLTLFVSGEVFSQSSDRSKGKKERIVQAEKTTINQETASEELTTELATGNKARIDTRDGSTYLGEFINKSDEAYTIRIVSGDTISIPRKEVRRAKTPENAIVLNKGKYHNTTGLFFHYSAGINAGQLGGGFLADFGLGYRLSKNLEIITGLGYMGTNVSVINLQNSWGEQESFFPAYVGAKYNLTHKSVRLFVGAKAGYSSSPSSTFDNIIWGRDELTVSGGVYFEPSIGLSFATKRLGQTSISVSQIMQRSNFELNATDRFDNLVTGSGKIWINRIGIKLTTTVF